MPLSKDSREFVECLNSNRVEYLVVGALAFSWHGYPRYSADVDFLVRPSRANAERLLSAIHQFRFGSLDIDYPRAGRHGPGLDQVSAARKAGGRAEALPHISACEKDENALVHRFNKIYPYQP